MRVRLSVNVCNYIDTFTAHIFLYSDYRSGSLMELFTRDIDLVVLRNDMLKQMNNYDKISVLDF